MHRHPWGRLEGGVTTSAHPPPKKGLKPHSFRHRSQISHSCGGKRFIYLFTYLLSCELISEAGERPRNAVTSERAHCRGRSAAGHYFSVCAEAVFWVAPFAGNACAYARVYIYVYTYTIYVYTYICVRTDTYI